VEVDLLEEVALEDLSVSDDFRDGVRAGRLSL